MKPTERPRFEEHRRDGQQRSQRSILPATRSSVGAVAPIVATSRHPVNGVALRPDFDRCRDTKGRDGGVGCTPPDASCKERVFQTKAHLPCGVRREHRKRTVGRGRTVLATGDDCIRFPLLVPFATVFESVDGRVQGLPRRRRRVCRESACRASTVVQRRHVHSTPCDRVGDCGAPPLASKSHARLHANSELWSG